VTDYVFQCSSRAASRALAKHNNDQTWLYRFDHAFSFGPKAWGPDYSYCAHEVCHGGDLPFWFGSAPYQGDVWSAGESLLAEQMQVFLGNFVATHSPNTGRQPPGYWPPAVHAINSTNIVFRTPQLMIDTNYNHINCNFWDGFYKK
jgi:carboxylesterase type B